MWASSGLTNRQAEPDAPRQLTYLPQGLRIGTHVRQYDQHVLLTLVGEELCRGQCQAWGDDPLNPAGMANGQSTWRPGLCSVYPRAVWSVNSEAGTVHGCRGLGKMSPRS